MKKDKHKRPDSIEHGIVPPKMGQFPFKKGIVPPRAPKPGEGKPDGGTPVPPRPKTPPPNKPEKK